MNQQMYYYTSQIPGYKTITLDTNYTESFEQNLTCLFLLEAIEQLEQSNPEKPARLVAEVAVIEICENQRGRRETWNHQYRLDFNNTISSSELELLIQIRISQKPDQSELYRFEYIND